MKLLNYKLSYLVSVFVLGILTGFYFSIPLKIIFTGFIISTAVLAFFTTKANKRFIQKSDFIIAAYLSFFLLGFTVVHFQQNRNYESHYINHFENTKEHLLFLKITQPLKSSKKFDKYEAELIQVDSTVVSGKVLLNVTIDSAQRLLTGTKYALKGVLREIKKPLNPGQFDYANYLTKKQIYHQIYTPYASIIQYSKSKSVIGLAQEIRIKIMRKLASKQFGKDELAIMSALLLGYRNDISPELYADFSSAGVIHILAISGLHIGILLILLNFLLRPLHRFKNGRVYKSVLIIILLWSFALLTGLSPSVVRSVTMFSMFAYALNRKKITSTYNVLFTSMFFLLLFKPLLIFDVGFQLSYAAVFAILWIQPLIYQKWLPKYKPIRYLWSLFTVTIAAQLGLLPLSLFYFHQFPGLFFVSNLVIIPFLGCLLGAGILVIILALCNILPDFLIGFYNYALNLLRTFVSWIARQENFIFEQIFFDEKILIISYLLLLTFVFLITRFSKKRIFAFTCTCLCFLGLISWNSQAHRDIDILVIFHQNRETVIARHKGSTMELYHNSKEISSETYLLKGYRLKYPFDRLIKDSIPDLLQYKNQPLVILDTIRTDIPVNSIILLRNSPKINLERLILQSQPRLIIADGSNYLSFKKRWKVTCKKEKLPFHDTYEKGAFIILDF